MAPLHRAVLVVAGARPREAVDAVKWAALERLEAIAEPAPPVRGQRASLAAELAVSASALGDDRVALRWTELVDRDWQVLSGRGQADLTRLSMDHVDELAMQRWYVELRAGRPAAPPWTAAPPAPSHVAERRRELEGVLRFLEHGKVDVLREAGGRVIFSDDPGGPAGILAGLQLAARGSGHDLARWASGADEDHPHVPVAVALLGARKLSTGREAMSSWLRRTPLRWYLDVTALAVDAANRQKIAEALGDRSLADDYRAQAARLRGGLLRRDTALVRRLLGVD